MKKTRRILMMALSLVMLLTILAPMAQAGTSFIYRKLEYGDSGQDVVQLQKSLKKLGFFSANTAGNYLDATQRAVKSYQRCNDLKVTNYCTISIQKRIYNDSSKIAERTLHYGDSGQDVKELQKALKTLGYFHGTVGGNYLAQTRDAVKAFQKDAGFKQTSYCTVAMQHRIRKAA